MKKFISMLLFLALLLGTIAVPDRAEAMEQAKKEQEAAVELLPVKRTEKKYKIFPASS